jgi:hypothetical protein
MFLSQQCRPVALFICSEASSKADSRARVFILNRQHEAARVDAAVYDLVGSSRIDNIVCMFCKLSRDGANMLLCDSCNGGVHFYCGPAPFHELPTEAHYYQCIYCVRFGGSYHPVLEGALGLTQACLQMELGQCGVWIHCPGCIW